MKEVWKRIPGYEKYDVSNLGRVRSYCQPGFKKAAPTPQRILKAGKNREGYLSVSLSSNQGRRKIDIHRLVALAFIGPPPDGMIVCHKDDNPANNNLENLKYGTLSENSYDALRNGRRSILYGEDHNKAKLTAKQVNEIRQLYATGAYTLVELGKMFGVHHTNISLIVKRKTWQNV